MSRENEWFPFLKDLVVKNRTYRIFDETQEITEENIASLIELARLSGFGGNRQSLKFWAILDEEKRKEVFKTLKWANYYKDWAGPEEGQRPTAYIIVFHDKDIANNYFWEHGLAAQSITLGAVAMGFGACTFASFDRYDLMEALEAPHNLNPLMVIALGKPAEEVVIECIGSNGSVEYWRDEEGRHHVPKRSLKDIMVIK